MNSGPAALYIHIPFCAKKCDYCDFYSIPVNDGGGGRLMDGFIEALAKDIEGQIKAFGAEALSSVYIGGGTPSLLGSRRMKELLDFLAAVLREYRRSPHEIAEFTVEVNPESLDEDFLRVCAEGGVTRISCGVQTFSEAARRAVGRGGGIGRLKSALSLLGE
ncbi:MAG: radical SAM protein, partial [Spirochaetaceae bacterium]|nr:radical SAM protein [Spirochaetaceae bacterium]